MNRRIKEVRKSTGKTQKVFGESLGVTRETLASYEIGRVAPSKTFIQLLCATYHVNEEWLTVGQGAMFIETREDVIQRFATEHGLTFYAKKVLETYLALDDNMREAVDGWLHDFVQSCKDDVEFAKSLDGIVGVDVTDIVKVLGANAAVADEDALLEAQAQAAADFAREEFLREKRQAQNLSSSTSSRKTGAEVG